MKKVFVSGCYDIVHAGHIQFFEEARALGDYLIVSFASEPVLWHHKQRKPSIPDEHKKVLLESLRMVDKVILGTGMKKGLDFEEEFLQEKPDILAVTEDDLYSDIKKELCARVGANYVVLPKTPPKFTPVSTTMLVNRIKAPSAVPLRVDFAGGWLDVPRYARKGSYVVNCAITPWFPSANGRMKNAPGWEAAARGPCWKGAIRSRPNSLWASVGRILPSLRKRGCAYGAPAVLRCWMSKARVTSWKEEWPFYIRVKNTTPQRWRMNNGTTYASPNPPSLPAPECWNATSIHWRQA
ncbi:adenylyltransferase/cytidyltransferase family protein [Akkermansia muciniphila]|uniref:adenylyltransferase/cytidyltransferase family protein n=1 Tax=Akkermansia muciniphila TaxID=239935 RepID=UPI001C82F943|nr:adenylyltransferase/cytidyltransferase family protein [Akkermansia muciniphila]